MSSRKISVTNDESSAPSKTKAKTEVSLGNSQWMYAVIKIESEPWQAIDSKLLENYASVQGAKQAIAQHKDAEVDRENLNEDD